MSEAVVSFKQLRVYRESCELDYAVFVHSKRFPKDETYSLTDQVRRASRAIGANIAEAWAKRRYPAHFVSKLTDADAELQETRHWIARAGDYGYLERRHIVELDRQCDRIGAMLGKMLQGPGQFTKEP